MSLEKEIGQQKNQEKLPDNVEIVKTEAGTFRLVYAVYGGHLMRQPVEDIGSRYGSVALEFIGSTKVIKNELSENSLALPYEHVLQKIAGEQKPVFIVDTASVYGEEVFYPGINALADLTAFGIAAATLRKNKQEEPMTRRSFLKKAAGLAAAGYVTTSALTNLVLAASPLLFGVPNRTANKIKEVIQPGSLFVLTLRNLIAAEKMEKIVKKYPAEFKGREFAALYGAAHTGLADALRMGHDARMQKIKSLGNMWPARETTGKGLARILRFDFDKTKGEWKMQEEFDEDIEKVIQ